VSRDAIRDEVCLVLRRQLGIEAPADDRARLGEELGLDSLALLTLVVELENRFRICIDPSEEERVADLGDLVSLIEDRLRAKPQEPQ